MKHSIILFLVLFLMQSSKSQQVELLRKTPHSSDLVGVSISPDNKHFVSVDKDGLAIIWDISTGQQYMVVKDVLAASFSSTNGGLFLAMRDKTFKMVDVLGNTINTFSTKKYEKSYERSRQFYPEAGIYITDQSVFDINKGFLRMINLPNEKWGLGQDFSPTLGLTAIVGDRGDVGLYSVETGQLVKEFKLKIRRTTLEPLEVQFSKDGSKLLIYKYDTLQIADVNNGKVVRTFLPDNRGEAFSAASLSPDGNQLLVATGKRALLFNINTGTKVWEQKHDLEKEAFQEVAIASFTPDGKKILIGSRKQFLLFNLASGALVKRFTSESLASLDNFSFVNNEKEFTAIYGKSHAVKWDLETGVMSKSIPYAFTDDGPRVSSIDGKTFFCSKRGNEELVVEIDESGKEKFVFPAFEKPNRTFDLAVSYDGQYLMKLGFSYLPKCTSGSSEAIELFQIKTHKSVFMKTCGITAAQFANTQNSIAIKEKWNGKKIDIYEIPSGRLLYSIDAPTVATGNIKMFFSSKDRYLALPSLENKSVTIVDIYNKQSRNFKSPVLDAMSQSDYIYEQGFTPDEKYLLYLTSSGKVLFFDIEAGKFDEQLTLSKLNIRSLHFLKNKPYMFINSWDGIIKVWNLQKKQIVATLYPNAENGNWAVVSPDGRFDANASGQANMFHVTGKDIVPLSAMFERYYTPRLLPRILEGEEFDPLPDVKQLKNTPVVTIQYQEGARNLVVDDDNATETVNTKVGTATLTVKAECPTDVVSEIRLYQNGKLVQTTRNLVVDDEPTGQKTLTKTFTVDLVEGANQFKALALNSQRTEGKPVMLIANYNAEKAGPSGTGSVANSIQLHLVVVGVNTYKNAKYNLNYAKADAEAFRTAMENGSKTIFSKVNTTYIQDADADKAGLVAAFEKVKATANPQDLFVFYYAGHGVMNDKKEFFLVPYDVTQLYGNDGALAQKGLSAAQIQQYSKDIKAQKQLFILDACQSAAALDAVALRGAAEEKAIAQLARSTGTHWLTASGSEQFASEFNQLGHGSFTYCLLEAFKGGADNGDKKLTVKELDAYLQSKVPEITQKYKGAAQYPASYGYGNDFPVIIIK